MNTLFDATLNLAIRLGALRTSTATGGTTGTTIDTVARTESDDTWNGGTIWIITDAGGASAAPEGEWAVITDFANSTGTISHGTLTAAVASGDTYGIANARYPLDVLKTAINNELIRYKIPLYDTTSLDIIEDQSEYTLPAGIHYGNLRGVYEATNDDSNENRWTPLNFDVLGADTGSQHTLVIDTRNVTAGNDLMLEYVSELTPVWSASSTIDPIIPMDLILSAAAANADLVRMKTYGSESDLDTEMVKEYRRQAEIAEAKNAIRLPARKGKVNTKWQS